MNNRRAFEATLEDGDRMNTCTIAMANLANSVAVLQERGADPMALASLIRGMRLLLKQAEYGARRLDHRALVEELLNDLKQGGPRT